MQFQVPQNIDLEDKIVGPLTLKNFLILLFGGMFIYALYFLPIPRALSTIIAIPVGLALIAATFVKVQDQSFPKFFMSLVYYLLRPKKRLWSQKDNKPEVKIKGKSDDQESFRPVSKNITSQQIAKLAAIVDTKGWKPISSQSDEEENIDLQDRVKSAPETKLPQSKLESEHTTDVLEVPPIEK